MKLKYMQNSKATVKLGKVIFVIVTTMTGCFVYYRGKQIGCAKVNYAKDFDYEVLLRFALHKSGSVLLAA